MTLDDFRATLNEEGPPAVPVLLQALWHDARGEWDAAHRMTQEIDSADAAWVHAYLHRKEGDPGNAVVEVYFQKYKYWLKREYRHQKGKQ